MKKLLSLLSVLTISGTAVPTTIAVSPYKKENNLEKNEINFQNIKVVNRYKRSLKNIIYNNENKIYFNYYSHNFNDINVDLNNNVYFLNGYDQSVWILKNGESTFIKYDKVQDVLAIIIDSKNNVYFFTKTDDFVLKNNKTELIKITGLENEKIEKKITTYSKLSAAKDSEDNIYFGTYNGIYKIKNEELIANKIINIDFEVNFNAITFDKYDNMYFASKNSIYYVAKNKFTPLKIYEIENNKEAEFLIIDEDNNIYFRKNSNRKIGDVFCNSCEGIWFFNKNNNELKHNELKQIKTKKISDLNNGLFIFDKNIYSFGNGLFILAFCTMNRQKTILVRLFFYFLYL